MTFVDNRALFEEIFSLRGKIVFALGAKAFPRRCRERGAEIVRSEDVRLEKTVFENISEPLARAGFPWENARERIARELCFWFGLSDEQDGFSATRAEELDAPLRTRLALARALAKKAPDAPLVVGQTLPEFEPQILAALKARAETENFAAFVEDARYEDFPGADLLAFFADKSENPAGTPVLCSPREAEATPESLTAARALRLKKIGGTRNAAQHGNAFAGTVVGAGAGEFLARAQNREIHGRLCGNVPDDVPEGAKIEIFLAPEIFHLDAFPPEENCFEVDSGGEIFFDGKLYYRQFATTDKAVAVNIAAQYRQTLEIPEGGSLFAWFFPEDALGFPA